MVFDASNWSVWSIRQQTLEKMLVAISNPVAAKAVSSSKGVEKPSYQTVKGIAIIPVTGPLTKRASFFTFLFGGSIYPAISSAVRQATKDPNVSAIVLDVDSPGGTVSGAEDLNEAVREAAKQKPVVAFANGSMCSAAYFFASAANLIMAERTAAVGSIGVIYVHGDFSRADSARGVTYTVLKAGKHKAIGNSYEPLTDDARSVIQKELDAVYEVFIDTVATNRGVSIETVRSKMADGRLFIGQEAVNAGLVDRVGYFQDAIYAAGDLIKGTASRPATPNPPVKASVSVSQLLSLVNGIYGSAEAEKINAMVDQGLKDPDRVLSIISAVFGEEKARYLSSLANRGITAAQFKVFIDQGIVKVSRKEKNAMGSNEKSFMELVEEYRWHFKCNFTDAMCAVMKKHPDAHRRYIEEANAGTGQDAPSGSQSTPDKDEGGDFMGLVRAHQAAHGSTLTDAMLTIQKSHPEAHQRYLEKFN